MPTYMRDLRLPLDPAPTEDEILKTIEERRHNIYRQVNQGRLSPEMKKKQIAELDKIEAVMKDPRERAKAIAVELDTVLGIVRKSIATMQHFGIDAYTKTDVERQANKLKLQPATVEQIYQLYGFKLSPQKSSVISKPKEDLYALLPQRYNEETTINYHIRSLWCFAEESKTMVSDLYSFMSYYSGLSSGTMTRDELLHMDRESLGLQVEQWAQDCAMSRVRNGLTTALISLLMDCVYMLKSDERKRQYHVSILYATCKALGEIEVIPESVRVNQQYADSKITEIAAHFHVDENVALAIYNDKIKPQVYIPQAD